MMGHKAELFTKDQPSRRNIIITTTARGNVTDHSNQESQEYIMMRHEAELFNMDQPHGEHHHHQRWEGRGQGEVA